MPTPDEPVPVAMFCADCTACAMAYSQIAFHDRTLALSEPAMHANRHYSTYGSSGSDLYHNADRMPQTEGEFSVPSNDGTRPRDILFSDMRPLCGVQNCLQRTRKWLGRISDVDEIAKFKEVLKNKYPEKYGNKQNSLEGMEFYDALEKYVDDKRTAATLHAIDYLEQPSDISDCDHYICNKCFQQQMQAKWDKLP
eukprot:477276-Rhodomonas_salina.1